MKTFTLQDQLFLAKRLSFLTQSGISLQESIELCEIYYKKHYKNLFSYIREDIEQGKLLSDSFLNRIKGISEFFIVVLKQGEETGTLSKSFSIIEKEITKRQAIKRRIISALIYPLCITVMTFVLTLFLILIIFPKIEPLFISMHSTLPWSTRFLIMLSMLVIYKWWLFVAVAFTCFCAYLTLKKNRFIQALYDRVVVTMPLISRFLIYKNLQTMLSNLGIMLQHGTSLHKAVQQFTFKNTVFNTMLDEVSIELLKGYTFSKTARHYPSIFSTFFIEFIYIAECSGKLSEGFTYMAEYYDQELEHMTKILTNLFEPLLMLVMGLIVGFVALSMILPMYGLTQSISSIH